MGISSFRAALCYFVSVPSQVLLQECHAWFPHLTTGCSLRGPPGAFSFMPLKLIGPPPPSSSGSGWTWPLPTGRPVHIGAPAPSALGLFHRPSPRVLADHTSVITDVFLTGTPRRTLGMFSVRSLPRLGSWVFPDGPGPSSWTAG